LRRAAPFLSVPFTFVNSPPITTLPSDWIATAKTELLTPNPAARNEVS
jgi:hypothetical protein